jgi:hypothetical protein
MPQSGEIFIAEPMAAVETKKNKEERTEKRMSSKIYQKKQSFLPVSVHGKDDSKDVVPLPTFRALQ